MFDIFCRHNWDLVSERELESNAEQAVRLGMRKLKCHWIENPLDKKLVQLLVCSKCGKVKKITTNF